MKRMRSEVERQALIADYLRLRDNGLNLDRQEAILGQLWAEFEWGWPKPVKRAVNPLREVS